MGEVIGIGEYTTRVMKEEGIECGFGVVGLVAVVFVLALAVHLLRHQDDDPTTTQLQRIVDLLEQGGPETQMGTKSVRDINASIRTYFAERKTHDG